MLAEITLTLTTLCMLGNCSCFCCRLLFFKFNLLNIFFSGTLSECQHLVRILAACKDYQQMTKVAASKERVNKQEGNFLCFLCSGIIFNHICTIFVPYEL